MKPRATPNVTTAAVQQTTVTGTIDFSSPPTTSRVRRMLHFLTPRDVSLYWNWRSWMVGFWVGASRKGYEMRLIGITIQVHLLCLGLLVDTGEPRPTVDNPRWWDDEG